jgi:hypothetical protein
LLRRAPAARRPCLASNERHLVSSQLAELCV